MKPIKENNNSIIKKIKFKYKLNSVEQANLYLSNRIVNCTPYYNVNKWEKDYERSQYYKNNHCQLPIIDFKKYKKQNKPNKRKNNNLDNINNKSTILSNNQNYSSFNSLNELNFSENNNIDYISLNFFLNNKSIGEYSYIIITYLEEIFSGVTNRFFNTAKFLNKEKIIGFTKEENDKLTLLELNKTVKDNGLKDGSKIVVQFK